MPEFDFSDEVGANLLIHLRELGLFLLLGQDVLPLMFDVSGPLANLLTSQPLFSHAPVPEPSPGLFMFGIRLKDFLKVLLIFLAAVVFEAPECEFELILRGIGVLFGDRFIGLTVGFLGIIGEFQTLDVDAGDSHGPVFRLDGDGGGVGKIVQNGADDLSAPLFEDGVRDGRIATQKRDGKK
ncbi:MAG: hypothetical protein U1D30_20960 [Planctomycetota bacterium]